LKIGLTSWKILFDGLIYKVVENYLHDKEVIKLNDFMNMFLALVEAGAKKLYLCEIG